MIKFLPLLFDISLIQVGKYFYYFCSIWMKGVEVCLKFQKNKHVLFIYFIHHFPLLG